MELTPIQKEILTALITIYRKKNKDVKGDTHAVKGEEIADIIDRNPGTVRNQMQSLKALGLVEGVPGPKGGYKATKTAYEVLDIEEIDKEAVIVVKRNGEEVKDMTCATIDFTSIRHPDICRASFRMIGDIRPFEVNDYIEVGPTPVNKTVFRGYVMGRDDTENTLICSISEMLSLPKREVAKYASDLIVIPSGASLQEASRILLENDLSSAPVKDGNNISGVASFKDICKMVAVGNLNAKIKEVASKMVNIEHTATLREAVQKMDTEDVETLIVTKDDLEVGIVTRTALLHVLADT